MIGKLKKIGAAVLVFLAGAVAAVNATKIVYGIPDHYDGSWGKVLFAALLALAFGAYAISGD